MEKKCAKCRRELTKEEIEKQTVEKPVCYYCAKEQFDNMAAAGGIPGDFAPPEAFGRSQRDKSIFEKVGIAHQEFISKVVSSKVTDTPPPGLIDPNNYKPTRIRFNFNNQDDTYAEIQVPMPLHPEIKNHVEHFLRAVVIYAQQMSTMVTLDTKSLAMLEDFLEQRNKLE